MNILLIAGRAHQLYLSYDYLYKRIVNPNGLDLQDAIQYLDQTEVTFNTVLICDETGFIFNDITMFGKLVDILQHKSVHNISIVIHSNFFPSNYYERLDSTKVKLTIKPIRDIRLSIPCLVQELKDKTSDPHTHVVKEKPVKESLGEKTEKKSFFDRFRAKPKEVPERTATDELTKGFNSIRKGIQRVVAITGHRGSGITSTSVNLAVEANKRGIKTIVIDMDTVYRSTNLYFSNFQESAQNNDILQASLIRTLAKPQDFEVTAYHVRDNLWLSTLDYSFHDQRLLEQFYQVNRLIGLISVLRQRFNLVILDFPMDYLIHMQEAFIHIDVFGLCVENNLYGIVSTLRNIEAIMNKENESMFNAKSKVIVTKYNSYSKLQDEVLTPQRTCELLSSDLSDCLQQELILGGMIPYEPEFDKQVEDDIPLVLSNPQFERAYGNVLLRLMEGA